MMPISSKASDLDIYHSSSSEDQPKSDDDDESISDKSLDINSLKTSHNTSGDMSESLTKSSIVESSATMVHSMHKSSDISSVEFQKS